MPQILGKVIQGEQVSSRLASVSDDRWVMSDAPEFQPGYSVVMHRPYGRSRRPRSEQGVGCRVLQRLDYGWETSAARGSEVLDLNQAERSEATEACARSWHTCGEKVAEP